MSYTKNIWNIDEQKILEMVLEEWLLEFQTIFKKSKKSDLDNFIFYARSSFIHNNVFRYAYHLLNNHPNWDDWENLVRQFYLKRCGTYRKISISSI